MRRVLVTTFVAIAIVPTLAAPALATGPAQRSAPAINAIDDPNAHGEWIADVERPATQFRGRYSLRLSESTSLIDTRASNPR